MNANRISKVVVTTVALAVVIAAAVVAFATPQVPSLDVERPDNDTFEYEAAGGGGGGTYIEGSHVPLAEQPISGYKWIVVSYRTTTWECMDAELYTNAGSIRGSTGGCGIPVNYGNLLNICGGVRNDAGAQMEVCFGKLGASVTSVRGTLDDGSIVADVPLNSVFIIAAPAGRRITKVEALGALGDVVADRAVEHNEIE